MSRRVDFSDYLFRCHALGNLMTDVRIGLTKKQQETFESLDKRIKGDGRPLTEKQSELYGELLIKKNAKPTLSKTAISYLEKIHREIIFGRSEEIQSKYLDKGVQVEEQSLTLYSDVCNKLLVKNKERFYNDYLTGEPDNAKDKVRDIKSSWDFTTFPMYAKNIPNKHYDWQLQGYMALTGLSEAELIYCLVDTPDLIIEDEKRRMAWKLGFIELPEELSEEIEMNLKYEDIPKEMRVKVFTVERDEKKIDAIYQQVELGRKYLNSLSEKVADRLELVG